MVPCVVTADLVPDVESMYSYCMHIGWLSLTIEVICPVEYRGGVWTSSKCEDSNYMGLYKTNNASG